MSVLRVQGGRRLEGAVTVEGNKNAALPLIVASLLTTEPVTLHNVPRIRDVDVLLDLLEGLGSSVEGRGTSTLRASRRGASGTRARRRQLVGRVRASMLLMGPLLARSGEVHLAPPGGDFPSRRTLSTHVQALTALGARPIEGAAHAFDAPDGLRGASFYLDEASVTATELALLAAVTARGRDRDPPRRDRAARGRVVRAARRRWAREIEGAGASRLRVHGVSRLHGATHTLRGDYIEAGTWAVIAAVTRGAIDVRGARARGPGADRQRAPADAGAVRTRRRPRARQCRAAASRSGGWSRGCGRRSRATWSACSRCWRRRPQGRTLIHDWMYELRLFALEQLSGMRADIFLCDSHRMVVTGPTPLRGRHLDTRDLRSGMALIAAALAAEGRERRRPARDGRARLRAGGRAPHGLGAVVAREG